MSTSSKRKPPASRPGKLGLLLLGLAALATTTLGGCGSRPGREPIDRTLPVRPAYVKPVERPDPRAGESLLVVAKRERQGRIEANGIIERFGGWYDGVRRRLAGGR
jgi:hypothetical protein